MVDRRLFENSLMTLYNKIIADVFPLCCVIAPDLRAARNSEFIRIFISLANNQETSTFDYQQMTTTDSLNSYGGSIGVHSFFYSTVLSYVKTFFFALLHLPGKKKKKNFYELSQIQS